MHEAQVTSWARSDPLAGWSAAFGLRVADEMEPMLEFATLVLFPILMAYAAASDLLTMIISNRISIILVLSFPVLALASGMPLAVIATDHLSCGLAVLCITFALFAFGWIGGGDAKLAASTALWLGWSEILEYGLLASIIGAALTIAIVQWRRYRLPAGFAGREWIARLHDAGNGVPYGIALAVAGLFLYPDTALWTAVVTR